MTEHKLPTSELIANHVERIAAGDLDGSGEAANEILGRVHGGDSVGVLRPMLESGDVACTRSLVFVLSELGLRSIEAMDWLNGLLDFPDEFVQHYAIVAIQHSGSLEHGPIVARALSKIRDVRPVSLAVVKMLAFGSLRQIATAEDFLPDDLREAVIWLTGQRLDGWERFFADDVALALVAVAGTCRLRKVNPAPFTKAMDDPRAEIGDAARYIARFEPLPVEGRDILHRIAASQQSSEGNTPPHNE
jgi:hypothetical protein